MRVREQTVLVRRWRQLSIFPFQTLHALFGDPIGPILADINAFLDSHTKEVVILDFQHVFEFKCNDHEALVDKLFKTFGDKLCPIREDVSQLSIEQMAHTNKRVIVIYPSMAKVHNVTLSNLS